MISGETWAWVRRAVMWGEFVLALFIVLLTVITQQWIFLVVLVIPMLAIWWLWTTKEETQ